MFICIVIYQIMCFFVQLAVLNIQVWTIYETNLTSWYFYPVIEYLSPSLLLDTIKRTVIWLTFQNISYKCCKFITIFTFCILHAYTCVPTHLAVLRAYVLFINVFIRSCFQILSSFLFLFFFFASLSVSVV